MTSLPIACTLSATEFPPRRSELAELGRTALIDARQHSARAELVEAFR
jgi:hypothetical protein